MGTVRHILQKKGNKVIAIEPSSTVFKALETMVEQNVGALIVMDQGKFAGMFTERDYARKVILKGKASRDTLVKEIMSEHPVIVSPDTTLDQCMVLMTEKYIRHLPVFENQQLVGLVSIGDIVKCMMDEQKCIIEDLEHYITGHHE
jgi:CBS domain-containing protein